MNPDLHNSRFLRACRRERVDRTPVWLMRQAGRYMSEYRALREKHSLLTLCRTPELATEVTLQPIRRFQLDAAIIFADILLPLPPMGIPLEFAKGEGPVIGKPITRPSDVDSLIDFDPGEGLAFVLQAIRLVTAELKVPLIGFAGAPFTLASYMIEGGHSRNFTKTKTFAYENREAWHMLMRKITRITRSYLLAQIGAGASAVQLFDSWAGALSPQDYLELVQPHSSEVLKDLGVPSIHFSTGTAGYLELIAQAGGDVIGIDWRIPLDEAWGKFPTKAIQGNLDPVFLLMPPQQLRERVRQILRQAADKPGHIFNLGHGVLPETPPESVDVLIDELRKA